MTTHTPEPWEVQYVPWTGTIDCKIVGHHTSIITTMNATRLEPREVMEADAARIVACVNGCAGLNPAAYRMCIDVLHRIADSSMSMMGLDLETAQRVKQALAHAEQTGTEPS